jgi:tRNA threonylcarbamoyladenosine biosynthesis protein TsaB
VADVTLVLEAAADGSIAVLRDGAVVAAAQVPMRGIPEDRLFPAVVAALDAAGGVAALTRVVCGSGPGSFTSLRVAAGVAKGLCAGASLPLFALPSLALAVPALGPGRYLVTLDALRGEVFAAVYAWDGATLEELAAARVVAEADLDALAAAHGATRTAARPDARRALPLLPQIVRAGTVDRATWEPAYGRLAEAQVRWEATHGRPLEAP